MRSVSVDRDKRATVVSAMHLCVADAMASRNLVDLPAAFGHVADLDAIIFVASDTQTADKRTATALPKPDQLPALPAPGQTRRPRLVAAGAAGGWGCRRGGGRNVG